MSIIKMKSKGQRPKVGSTRGGAAARSAITRSATDRSAARSVESSTSWKSKRKVLKITQREWKRRRQSIITSSSGSLVVVRRDKAS